MAARAAVHPIFPRFRDPHNAVAMGNPATVVGRTGLLLEMMDASPDTLDTYSLPPDDRERRLREHFGIAPSRP